jgi:hypothetical protein
MPCRATIGFSGALVLCSVLGKLTFPDLPRSCFVLTTTTILPTCMIEAPGTELDIGHSILEPDQIHMAEKDYNHYPSGYFSPCVMHFIGSRMHRKLRQDDHLLTNDHRFT